MSARPDAVRALPAAPGVYRFVDAAGRALYVGRAVDLRRRVGSYWGDLRDRRRLARMVPRIARIEALVCDSEHEAAWLERNLLHAAKPRWNRARDGQETPTALVLSAHGDLTSRPLGLVPEPEFGPYLGGAKVRLAAAALRRIHPSGRATTAAERELAALRGAVPTPDRIAAVLRREPGAVAAARASLTARRDAASADLRFEAAAVLSAELAAVDWITGPQRVTALDPYDAVITASAGGIQLDLRIEAGRLTRWTQSPGEGATCPPDWHDWAARNAELAATLSGRPVTR